MKNKKQAFSKGGKMGSGKKEKNPDLKKNTIFINRELVNKVNIEFTVLSRIFLERVSEIRKPKKISGDIGDLDFSNSMGEKQ